MPVQSIRELDEALRNIGEPQTDREREAVRISRALLGHLRNFGTPETPPPSLKLRSQSLNPRASAAQKRFVIHHQANDVPMGAVTIHELASMTGYGIDHVRKLTYDGVFPRAFIQGGASGPSYWTQEQAEQIRRIAAQRGTRRAA